MDDQALPDIQRALAFHMVISQCITAGDNRLNGGSWNRRFNPAVGSISRRSAGDIVRLAKRMRDVQLENSDALGLLERTADGDYAVIYCDPPYPTANTDGYAIGDFDFDRLADLLRLQKGRGCGKWVFWGMGLPGMDGRAETGIAASIFRGRGKPNRGAVAQCPVRRTG